jgi:hypothetical protein
MIRILLLALGLVVVPTLAHAQSNQPLQSLRPTQGVCGTGSQSVRVCQNALTSCNDVCTARALAVNADIAGCSTACCVQFNVCLRVRNCGDRVIDCN